ncbi:MAG: hypothetical protein IJM94_00940 [Clostridia bacterium]|nr:hypothetical protein [Clostridia bacterium]
MIYIIVFLVCLVIGLLCAFILGAEIYRRGFNECAGKAVPEVVKPIKKKAVHKDEEIQKALKERAEGFENILNYANRHQDNFGGRK